MGNEMVRFVEVNGWQVAVGGVGDEQEKIRDVDLADKLGYTRSRDIRKLIERLMKEGKLPGVCQRATVARYESRPGVFQEREVTEYWLNEPQALKVIAKSSTPTADEILDQIITVFVYVRRNRELPARENPEGMMLQARSAFLREMRPYYEDCLGHLDALESVGVITSHTRLAHRTKILQEMTGIDLTRAPVLEFQNTTLVQASSVKIEEVKTPGDTPLKQLTIVAEADLTGFRTCNSIASEIGAPPSVVSKIGKAMGWHGAGQQKGDGVWVPVMQNGQEIRQNWQYNEKLVPMFRSIWMKCAETKNALPKKYSWEKVVGTVCTTWKNGPQETAASN